MMPLIWTTVFLRFIFEERVMKNIDLGILETIVKPWKEPRLPFSPFEKKWLRIRFCLGMLKIVLSLAWKPRSSFGPFQKKRLRKNIFVNTKEGTLSGNNEVPEVHWRNKITNKVYLGILRTEVKPGMEAGVFETYFKIKGYDLSLFSNTEDNSI